MKRIQERLVPVIFAAILAYGGGTYAATLPPGLKPDITVAADGSGDFKSVQAAIDSIPANNTERKFIYIKNGTYDGHIQINNSFITLLGEDRFKTIITYAFDDTAGGRGGGAATRGARGARGAATGPAARGPAPQSSTPNAANAPPPSTQPRIPNFASAGGARPSASFNLYNANDIVLDNLTVSNPVKSGVKPIVVYSTGEGTRIVIQNAEILGLGGDTLSLWTNGMYYHHNIHVTGTYHFVGPRGTCYMSDSLIEAQSPVKNMIFNEGRLDIRQKLVMKNCKIISPVPVGLGSYFRDACWYFVDCQFPDTLQPDGNIFIAQPNVNNPQPVSAMFQWPTGRVYFSGIKGPNYPWLKDNIDQSPAKTAATITPAWTFWDQWDPETTAAPMVASASRAGDVVSIKFSESVTVKGKPAIKLADGKTADYVAGSGTDTLTFKAPTAAAADTLELNGGTIFASIATAQTRAVADSIKLQK